MDVVVKIEGRDALPVWTIPYVTAWDISPDMLLKRLVYPYYNNEKNEPIFPAAFNLDSSGCPRVIPSEQWADVENRIAMLKDDLDAREDNETSQSEDLFDLWCTRSIDRIIKWAGCRYIWLSEFSEWLERYNDFDHIIFMKQVKVADDKTDFTERHIDLNLDPNLISEHELHFKNTELGKIKSTGSEEQSNGKKNRRNIFDKRLDALTAWLISLGYNLEDKVIILPKHYTPEIVYTELGKYTEKSKEYKGLFATIELSSFDSHFWGKQKIVELMRGNKSAVF